MAYPYAGDGFLPSWGSGMRPRDPNEAALEESLNPYGDYVVDPAKPWKSKAGRLQAAEADNSQLTAYGTMTEVVPEKKKPRTEKVLTARQRMRKSTQYLIFWPLLVSSVNIACFAFLYWAYAWVAYSVLALSFLVGAYCCYVGWYRGGFRESFPSFSDTFFQTLGILIFVGSIASVLLGLFCYYTWIEQYDIYKTSPVYSNVIPSTNPGDKRDAGTFFFAPGVFVEPGKSAGVMNGNMYCAAPIMTTPRSPNSYVGYWAAGLNCCRGRGQFTCGGIQSVDSLQARSGLVVLDSSPLQQEIPEYRRAAMEAAEQNGLAMPEDPIFVRWTTDVTEAQDAFWSNGWNGVLYCILGVFVSLLLLSLVFHLMRTGAPGEIHDHFADRLFGGQATSLEEREHQIEDVLEAEARQRNLSADPFLSTREESIERDPFMTHGPAAPGHLQMEEAEPYEFPAAASRGPSPPRAPMTDGYGYER